MSFASLFTGNSNVSILQNGFPVLQLDCSVKETHSRSSPPTEFEIENGQTISDHIIVKPFSLKLTGLITDSPISLLSNLLTAGISKVLPNPGVLGKGASALALLPVIGGTSSPSTAAYLQLLQMQSAALPVSVFTSLFLYKNMWIKDISVPRDAKTGKCLLFDVEFVQLLLVSPTSVDVSFFAAPDISAAQANEGAQQANLPLDAAKKGFSAGGNAAAGNF